MREVIDATDRLGIKWYVTGSVAAALRGVLRSSQDIDAVMDLDVAGFPRLATLLEPSHAIAEPIGFEGFARASVIDRDVLVWSEGASELQRRDCAQLVRIRADRLDRAYGREASPFPLVACVPAGPARTVYDAPRWV
jgi:hypothetical protein